MSDKVIHISEIIEYLDHYLNSFGFNDYCKNGLQIQGNELINGIIGGVSINADLIGSAIKKNINTILVHHGLIWKNTDLLELKGCIRIRLKKLLSNDINLIGYHLPLDAHPESGNNISIIRHLGIPADLSAFDVGFHAVFSPPLHIDHIMKKLSDINPGFKFHGPAREHISKVTVVSGGSSHLYESAVESKCDLFICGEIKEPVFSMVRERETGYISLGHYYSEIFGIKNLCSLINNRFNLYTEFIDIPNPY